MKTLGWWARLVLSVVVVAACGPDDTVASGTGSSESSTGPIEPVEPSAWMSGIWSTDYMTLGRMTPGQTPDGVGEHNDVTPSHYIFDASGILTLTRDINGPPSYVDETFRYRWFAVSDVEIRAELIDEDGLGFSHYRIELFAGMRGCDALRVTGIESNGEPTPIPWELHRGSICTLPIAECPDEWDEGVEVPPPCEYYYYTWCDEQGDNVPVTEPCDQDCYCHLPE